MESWVGNARSNISSTTEVFAFTYFTEIRPVSHAQTLFELSSFCLALFFGITGNIAVLVAVGFDPRLHTATNYLIANQAASDLLFLCGTPFWTVNRWLGYWPGGDALCKVCVYVQYVGSSVSIYSLCAIAVERLRSFSRNRGTAMTWRQTAIVAAAMWIWTLLAALAMAAYSEMDVVHVDGRALSYCFVDGPFHTSTTEGRAAVYLFSVGSFAGPAMFIVFVYASIIHRVRKSRQRMRIHRTSTSRSRAVSLERRLVLMLLISAVLFFAMWTPSIVVNVLAIGHEYHLLSSTLVTAAAIVGTINTFVNPLLLFVFNLFFREDVLYALSRRWWPACGLCRPTPASDAGGCRLKDGRVSPRARSSKGLAVKTAREEPSGHVYDWVLESLFISSSNDIRFSHTCSTLQNYTTPTLSSSRGEGDLSPKILEKQSESCIPDRAPDTSGLLQNQTQAQTHFRPTRITTTKRFCGSREKHLNESLCLDVEGVENAAGPQSEKEPRPNLEIKDGAQDEEEKQEEETEKQMLIFRQLFGEEDDEIAVVQSNGGSLLLAR